MAKLVPTGKTGKSLPLSLTKALQMTQPKVAKQRRQKFLENLFVQQDITQDLEHWNLIDFVSQHPSAAQKVQQKFNARWVIVQQQNLPKMNKLVYDGSHASVKRSRRLICRNLRNQIGDATLGQAVFCNHILFRTQASGKST